MAALSNRAPEDVELVRASLAGSQEAFHDLVVRYQRPIFSLVRRMVRNESVAEELAQEVFLKAYRALETYDQNKKFSNWLFKIAHNASIDHLRRRRLAIVPLESTEHEGTDLLAVIADRGASDPEHAAEVRDLAAALERAVAALKPAYREAVLLRYGEGLAYEEIAEVTDLPLGTVKTHLFRARKAMVEFLEEEGWKP